MCVPLSPFWAGRQRRARLRTPASYNRIHLGMSSLRFCLPSDAVLLLLLLPRTWVEHGVIADGARSDSTNPKGGVGAHEPWACLGLPPMPLPPCLCLALSSRMLHLSVIFDIRLQFLRPARDLTGGNHFRGTFFVWTLTSLNKLLSV